MRRTLSVPQVLFALFAVASAVMLAQQGKFASANYIPVANIQAALKRSPQAAVNPQPNISVVDAGGYNVAVGAIHRPETPPGVAAIHYKVTEIYQVIEGAGTLVTGGTMINSKERPLDSESVRFEDGPGASGTGIQGGVSLQIKAGDVVIIPAGVPHWFSKIEGSISYVVVRVDPDRVIPTR